MEGRATETNKYSSYFCQLSDETLKRHDAGPVAFTVIKKISLNKNG